MSTRLAAISAHLPSSSTSSTSMATLFHPTLKVTLEGVRGTAYGLQIDQYRGMKYGKIPGRFERAVAWNMKAESGDVVDCREFGPVCPQNYTSPSVLLRIPERLEDQLEPQDEFECLNLTVTLPAGIDREKKLPVLVWIYGGSQTMTFGGCASKVCDMRRIVADSVKLESPILVVALNYRLNIFGFGDGGETNLALKDQVLAIEWVRENIGGFGGDKDNITLAGESAGAVYTHAHTIIGTRIKRAIAMSGSLTLSPAMPPSRGKPMIAALSKKVQESDGCSLKDAPVESFLRHQKETGIVSVWLQATDELAGWQDKTEQVEELMIGDCEYESVLWRNGIETMTAEDICSYFSKPKNGAELREAYGIVAERSTACKLGALDFLDDFRFAMPPNDIAARWRKEGRKVYQYIVDQPNPWQSSSRAHHAVDLLLLFGGHDFSVVSPGGEEVGAEMRKRWISFINGKAPWSVNKRMAFGPVGECKELDEKGYRGRRRVGHFDLLKRSNPGEILSAFAGLAMGRISLDN